MGTSPQHQYEVVDKLFELDDLSRPARDQRLLEARITFALACVLLLVGAGLIFWGALHSEADFTRGKLAAGALIGIGGGTLLKLHKSAHDQLEKYRKDQAVMTMIGLIKHDDERDKAIKDFLADQKNKGLWKRITGG